MPENRLGRVGVGGQGVGREDGQRHADRQLLLVGPRRRQGAPEQDVAQAAQGAVVLVRRRQRGGSAGAEGLADGRLGAEWA